MGVAIVIIRYYSKCQAQRLIFFQIEYERSSCYLSCGDFTQRYYYVPPDYINFNGKNLLVILEEVGGDPSSVNLIQVRNTAFIISEIYFTDSSGLGSLAAMALRLKISTQPPLLGALQVS